jgi:UDP-N-acetylmuramoyl-L-alanyl-D-glutamate--2,6-diaminopimelate ligase
MQAAQAFAELNALARSGRGDIEVRGVQYDSRRVSSGDIFVAMRGGTTDGNKYIEAAIRKGAVAIVTDAPEIYRDLEARQPELAIALVDHGRRALAEVSATVFDSPQKKLKLSAVTGTNGKTTTAFLLEQLLQFAARKCILLGTIETHVAGTVRASEHTTPESRDILALFAEGVRAGCTEAVMEMSSHALDQERVWGLPVDVAIFTNLTQDHLDYHGTMDDYAAAKTKLFRGVGSAPPRISVINLDDAYGSFMEAAADGVSKVWTYGINQGHGWTPEFLAQNIRVSAQGASFEFVTPFGSREIISPLSGWFNVHNLLAAMVAALARGMTLDEVVQCVVTIRSAPGRFEVVPESRQHGFTVVVDYAHTDDALYNVIAYSRNLVEEHNGRVITLFGCGGDRDRTKRPKMGRAAAEGSDLVIVTSDNPRSEDPIDIIEEILPGVREGRAEILIEPDRRAAIQRAIASARPGDIVLLAGKGHEKVQITAHGTTPFDDVAEAALALQSLQEVTR